MITGSQTCPIRGRHLDDLVVAAGQRRLIDPSQMAVLNRTVLLRVDYAVGRSCSEVAQCAGTRVISGT
jgi:hypothetical protein